MNIRKNFLLGAVPLLAFGSIALAGDEHDHGGDIIVGRTGGGQLALEFDSDEPFELPAVSGLLDGFALDEPGFLSLDTDEPAEDFFVLQPGADVIFELISIDPAFKIWSPGFADLIDTPGEQFILGESFDVHATFHVDSLDPLFDSSVASYDLSFRLLDGGSTGYGASDTVNLTFVPIPEPTTAILMSCGLLALARSRSNKGFGRTLR